MARDRTSSFSAMLLDWYTSWHAPFAVALTAVLLLATPGVQALSSREAAESSVEDRLPDALQDKLPELVERSAQDLARQATGQNPRERIPQDVWEDLTDELPEAQATLQDSILQADSVNETWNTTRDEFFHLLNETGLFDEPLIDSQALWNRTFETFSNLGPGTYDVFKSAAREAGIDTSKWPSYGEYQRDPVGSLADDAGVNESVVPGVEDPREQPGTESRCVTIGEGQNLVLELIFAVIAGGFLLGLCLLGAVGAVAVAVGIILIILIVVITVALLVLGAALAAFALAEGAAATASAWAETQKSAIDAIVATQATQTTASAQTAIADLDETRNGVGDSFEDVYQNATHALLDPDQDGALTITEFQWNTVPDRNARWDDALGPFGLSSGESVNQTLGRYASYPNAPDTDGDGWKDGPEITYWSRVMGVVFQDRLNQTSPASYSDVQRAWPEDELQGPWSQATGLVENTAPNPCPHVDRVLEETHGAGTTAIGAAPDSRDVFGSTWDFTTYKNVSWQMNDFGFWTADSLGASNCQDLKFDDRAPSPPDSWQEMVANLNGMTGLAWRHPGYFFDTDGDGYANVRDPDSDNDRLMDGHTTIIDRDDPRYDCYTRSQANDPCPPYDSHPLVHESGFWSHVFPGELTLGSYPEFTDSDCQATLPGDETPSRCSPSSEPGRQGTPGHGDQLNDTAEYEYWSSLKQDDRYAAFHPNATDASHPAEPWNTSYDWDPAENVFLDADSDDDGLLDGEEIKGCRIQDGSCEGDVTSTAAWTDDTDGDGLKDAEEDDWGTDPTAWDSDGDNLPDGWEAWYGLDPTTPQTDNDPDGDGLSNRQEYCMGDSDMPGPTSLCGDEDKPGWTANWCGPNPQQADTDEDGIDDGADVSTTYDCTEPSAIGGPDSRVVAPYNEPNQDLGTLDPQSEDWLATGRYAEKAAAHPVNFTNRTLADPVEVAREIQENLTEDTETLTRMVTPPVARHEAWRTRETVAHTVETLLACPRPVSVHDASVDGVTDALPPIPGSPAEGVETVRDKVDEVHDTGSCMSGALMQTVDDATGLTPSSLIAEPVAPAQRLAGNATEPVPSAPATLDRVTSSVPDTQPLNVTNATLDAVDTTVGALEDEALQPAVQDPWSLVAEPDAFPNLAADASANRLTPDTLYDQLAQADQALGSETQLISTADATHWDLLIQFPNRTPQQIQNIPLGTPRPVNLYEDCVSNPTNTSQLENASSCATELADPDLTVELTPQTSGTSLDGYAFTATKHTEEPLEIGLTALVQVPNREEAFAVGIDGRPDAAANLSGSVDVGPIPDQFQFTVEANQTDGQRLSTRLQQTGATNPLVATGGRFAVDTHDPNKPALDEPRTEASVVLFDPPNQVSTTTTQQQGQTQEELEVSWTSSAPTRVAASVTTVDAGGTTNGVLGVDQLPTQGTVILRRTPTLTDLTVDTTDASQNVLDEVTLHGSIEDASTASTEPTILNALVQDPPELAHLVIDRGPEGANTEVRYDASSAFQRAVVTRFAGGASCPVIPADNQIVVQEGCTHANLTGLEQATVSAADNNLTANWTRSTGQGNLSVRVDRAGVQLDALVDPWPSFGNASARWPSPLQADWSLSSGLDRFLADVDTPSGTQGLLDISGLPATGNVNLDLGQRNLDIVPDVPIDRVQARVTTDGQLPAAPSGDYALVDRPNADTLRARLLLHDLGETHAAFGTDNADLGLRTSQGRELTVQADTPNANAHVNVDTMPGELVAGLARSGSNTTLDLAHTGSQLPTITARGNLEDLGFDVSIPNVPQSVEGFLDAQGGNLGLEASSPLSVDAKLTGDPGMAPSVIPLRDLAPGVSMALESELDNQQPGIRVDLDNVEHARLHREPADPNDPTSQTRFTGEIRLSQSSPLVVSSIEDDATHYAKIEDVPADANFTARFNDRGGHFDYDATHPIDNLRVARIAPDTFFHAWTRDVPTSITADWTIPEELTDGTLTGSLEHDANAPIPKAGFKWVDDSVEGQRSAKMFAARNVSSPTSLTFEDRHNLSVDLGHSGDVDHLAALYADRMPVEDVTLPDNGTHGVHYQAVTEERQSFGARLSGLQNIDRAEIPTADQPTLDLEATLSDAKPFELYVDDPTSDLLANATIAQLGGGTIDLDGRIAFSGDPARAAVDATLPTPPGDAHVFFRNATTWFDGTATTQATDFNLTLQPPEIALEANDEVNATLRGAARGGQAPAALSTGSYAAVDLREAVPRVSARVDGLESLTFDPTGPGHLSWDTTNAQPFDATVHTTNWTIRSVHADPLTQTGTVNWNATDGLTGDFNLSSALDRLTLDTAYTPVDDDPVQVDATLENVGGSGSVTFDPDRAARLDVPDGIGDVQAEVFLNASQELDLTTLDETLGLVFDDPADSENAAYGKAVAANLTDVTGLDSTLATPDAGGLEADGTLALTAPIDDGLRLRANTPGGWFDANTTNLPAETTFHVDTRNVTGAEGDKVPLSIDLDWGTDRVRQVHGSFRTYADASAAAGSTDGDGDVQRGTEQDRQGNVTAYGVQNVTIEKQRDVDGDLVGRVGADATRLAVRLDEGNNRTGVLAVSLDGVYDVRVDDDARSGRVELVQGSPVHALELERKAKNAPSRSPDTNQLDDPNPQYLIAQKNPTTGEVNYTHARIQDLAKADWSSSPTGIDATLDTASLTGLPTFLAFHNGTQHVNASVTALPDHVELGFHDRGDTKTIDVTASSPLDIPLLSYRNTTAPGVGVPAQSGDPVNVSLTAKQLQGLDNTTLSLTTIDENASRLQVDTDGLEHARLFGVLRGSTSEPGEGEHVFTQLDGVPATVATIEYDGDARPPHATSSNDDPPPLVSVDSTNPIDHTWTVFTSPVSREPAEVTPPDRDEFIDVQTRANDTVEGEQLVVQADLSQIQAASLDPSTPLDGCTGCTPVTVALHRGSAGGPLFANLDASMLPATGTIDIQETPQQMQLGFATKETTIQTNGDDGGSENVTTDAVVDYDASGALQGLDADLTADVNGTSTRFNASVGTFPSSAEVHYERNPTPHPTPTRACGLSFTEKVPGRIRVATPGTTSPLENADLTLAPADAGSMLLSPGQAENYVGLQTGGTVPHARVLAERIDHLNVSADPTGGSTGGFVGQATLGGLRDLSLEVVDTNASQTSEDDIVFEANATTGDWPVTVECSGAEIEAYVGAQDSPTSGTLMKRLHVAGHGFELLNRSVTGFNATVLDVETGVMFDGSPEDASGTEQANRSGFEVTGFDQSSIERLFLDAQLAPPTEDEAEQCRNARDASGGPGDPWEVTWTVPLQHSASFQISTNNQDRQVPGAHMWFQYRDTCEEFTAAGQVGQLNHLLASNEPSGDGSVTEVDLSMDQSLVTGLDLASYDDGRVSTKRVNVTAMPTEFWIRMPEERAEAEFKTSEYIQEFEYITNGCRMVNLNGIEPTSEPVSIISGGETFEGGETIGRFVNCQVQAHAVDWTISGVKSVGRAIVKVSDGAQTALDATWNGVKGGMSFLMDLDGHSEQRDRPRFSRLDANVKSFAVSANNEDDGTGEHWAWGKGRIDANTQPQWYQSGSSGSSDTKVQGTIEVPDWMTEKQCLDWNYTTDPRSCDEWESWGQVQERVAEHHLEDSFLFKLDHGSEEKAPARAWAEAVR